MLIVRCVWVAVASQLALWSVVGCSTKNVPSLVSTVTLQASARQGDPIGVSKLEEIKQIAGGAGIIGAHGSSYTYIDGTPAGGYMIVQETFASRTEYKSITPIIRVDEEGLVIDCSYVRSVDEVDGVAVGRYCGGARIATADALEEAVDDGHMLLFSPRASWLNLLNVGACKNRAGLIYINLYVVRCGAADVGEVTSSVSVKVFSSENKLLLSMGGYELAPDIQASNPRALTFWRLDGDSHHVIVERVLPGGTVLD